MPIPDRFSARWRLQCPRPERGGWPCHVGALVKTSRGRETTLPAQPTFATGLGAVGKRGFAPPGNQLRWVRCIHALSQFWQVDSAIQRRGDERPLPMSRFAAEVDLFGVTARPHRSAAAPRAAALIVTVILRLSRRLGGRRELMTSPGGDIGLPIDPPGLSGRLSAPVVS